MKIDVKRIVRKLLDEGVLVSPEIVKELSSINSLSKDKLKTLLEEKGKDSGVVENINFSKDEVEDVDKTGGEERERVEEGEEDENKEDRVRDENIDFLMNYRKKSDNREYEDFVEYFNQKYNKLKSILRKRPDVSGTTSIRRINSKNDRGEVSVIGMVKEKRKTKKNHMMITLEDPTDEIKTILTKEKEDLSKKRDEVVLDEVIAIKGQFTGDVIFINEIIFPDFPINREVKKSPEEEYLAVIGDPHVGSKLFMEKEFNRMIKWLRGELGNKSQRRIASKVKYIIIPGDGIEGVGIYPDQEEDLEVKSIKDQYSQFMKYLKRIPSDKSIVFAPGNHDATRLEEPQSAVGEEYLQGAKEMENLTLTSNPSFVRLGATEDFEGFKVLVYHGYSLIYYSEEIPYIREKGGQKRSDLVMELLLRKRHLAPSHDSNLYLPDSEEDPMVIEEVPDIFVTGHIHRMDYKDYKGITCLNCSCWSEISEDQKKRGLEPQPARLPLVNLKTRDVKVINFKG